MDLVGGWRLAVGVIYQLSFKKIVKMADLGNLLDDLNPENNNNTIDDFDGEGERDGDYVLNDEEDKIEDQPLLFESRRRQQQNISEYDMPTQTSTEAGFDDNDSSSGGGNEEDDDEDGSYDGDGEDFSYSQLKHLWITEKLCPELCPYDTETIDNFKSLLESQEERMYDLLSANAEKDQYQSARYYHNRKSQQDIELNMNSLGASMYRMEMDRVRFILADLMRTRLSKIESYPIYFRDATEEYGIGRMSPEEVEFLGKYGQLLEKYLHKQVLNHFPKGDMMRKLDDPEMVDSPNLEEYIFCKIIENCLITEEPPPSNDDDEEEDQEGMPQEYSTGSCLVVKYKLVRDLIMEGKVSLLL